MERYRWENGCTTTLLLEVFTQRNFVADFIRLKLNYIKNKKIPGSPFGGFRGTPSIARWKACGRLSIVVIKLFCYFLRLRRYKRKSVEVGVFRRGGSLWIQISDERGRRPTITVGVRKLEWLPFRVLSKYRQCFVWFSQSTHVTDRQTDRQTDRIIRLPRPR